MSRRRQIKKSDLVAAASRARAGVAIACQGRSMRLCLHQAEAARQILELRGIDAQVVIGGIRLPLGRDHLGGLALNYNPHEIADEWHAWLRVGEWLVDASMADLQQQLVNSGEADAASYQQSPPFDRDVLVARASRLRKGYRPVPELDVIYNLFTSSPSDAIVVSNAVASQQI